MTLFETLRDALCDPTTSDAYRTLQKERNHLKSEVERLTNNRAELQRQKAEIEAENEQLEQTASRLREKIETLEQRKQIDVSIDTVTRDKSDLGHELRDESWFDSIDYWHPMNSSYRCPHYDDFVTATDEFDINEYGYTTNYFDCVDYTTALRAEFAQQFQINSIGQVITTTGSAHAFNAVYTADEGIVLWEPQSNTRIEANSGELYQMDSAIVHL